MTILDSVYDKVQYSNEVTLNAKVVCDKYFIQLNQLQEIAHNISSFSTEFAESLPVELRNKLVEISNSVVDLNEENVKNFTAFMEFTNWNLEKLQETMTIYEYMLSNT